MVASRKLSRNGLEERVPRGDFGATVVGRPVFGHSFWALHLSGAREVVIDETTILVSPLVKVSNCGHARCARLCRRWLRSFSLNTSDLRESGRWAIANDFIKFAIYSPLPILGYYLVGSP